MLWLGILALLSAHEGFYLLYCGMLNEFSVLYFQCRTSRHALASIARVRPAVFITSVAREITRYNNLAANAQVRGHSFAKIPDNDILKFGCISFS